MAASQPSNGVPVMTEPTRESLVSRQLPEMTLSTGDETSKTAPPLPIPHYLDATGRALYRFSVEGNAILTGGAGTLALSSARALLDHGLRGLALWDILFSPEAEADIETLQDEYPDATIVPIDVDIREEKSVETAMEATKKALSSSNAGGAINILICFAGVVSCINAIDMKSEEWRRVMDINCTGGFLCAKIVAREMIANNTSNNSITFISSLSAHRVNYPQPQASYNVSKAGIKHLARCLAAEWAVHGIRVNSISPGYMDTILNEGEGLDKARKMWNARNPMGRMGQPMELQGPLVMLCSQAGSFINGADLKVDGGASVF